MDCVLHLIGGPWGGRRLTPETPPITVIHSRKIGYPGGYKRRSELVAADGTRHFKYVWDPEFDPYDIAEEVERQREAYELVDDEATYWEDTAYERWVDRGPRLI